VEYVYFVSSLPRLELTGPAPFPSEELLRAAGGVLRRDHWEDLEAILEDRPRDVVSPEARDLVGAERRLRVALARARAHRAGAELSLAGLPEAEFDARAAELAARVMSATDPLERELLLDRARWEHLEEASAFPAFGAQAVFAYAIKLRMVEKWSAMSDEAGLELAVRIADDNLVAGGL